MAVYMSFSNEFISANNQDEPDILRIFDSDGEFIDYIDFDFWLRESKEYFKNKEVIQILPNSKDADLRNLYRRKNYRQTSGYPYRSWTQHEIDLVLAHNMPDRELSTQIQRSVMSIQLMRCRAKKGSSL